MIVCYEALIKGPIKYQNRKYNLNNNFFVSVEVSESGFFIKDVITGIYGYGDSFIKAIKNFSKLFDFQYQKLIIHKNCISKKDFIIKHALEDIVENEEVYAL